MKAQFVTCFATTDNKVARLHAFMRGEGSLRDENHIREIVAMFTRGNDTKVIPSAPAENEKVLYEVFLSVENTRHGHSRYSGWDFKMHPGCPQCVAEAGHDIYVHIKKLLKNAKQNSKENK